MTNNKTRLRDERNEDGVNQKTGSYLGQEER
jgi:hypothetical protein